MKIKLLLLPIFCISHLHASQANSPQTDTKASAEVTVSRSKRAKINWRAAKYKFLTPNQAAYRIFAEIRQTKLALFKREGSAYIPDPRTRNGILTNDLERIRRERNQLQNAFERAKEYQKEISKLKTDIATDKNTIKLLETHNRNLAAQNKALTAKIEGLSKKQTKDELP